MRTVSSLVLCDNDIFAGNLFVLFISYIFPFLVKDIAKIFHSFLMNIADISC